MLTKFFNLMDLPARVCQLSSRSPRSSPTDLTSSLLAAGAVFGDKSILIVNGVVLPSLFNFSWTGATGKIARDGPCQSWFQTVARIPPLDDRVWDARLIQCGDIYPAIKGEKGKGKGESRKMRLVAAALAHNCVEVCTTTKD